MSTWERIAPLTAVAAVALIAVSFIVGGEPPDVDAPAGELVTYYAENDTEIGVASALGALGAAFFVFFSTTLFARLRVAAGGASALASGVLVGGALVGLGIAIFSGLGLTLSDVGGDIDPAATQALHALSVDFFFPVAVGTVVFSWSVALAVLRGGGLPGWLGWIAIVIAVASVTPAGFFAFLAMGLWSLIASIVMMANPEAV